jgi:hypothetical protein
VKYGINNISNIVQSNHLNIDCLLTNANKSSSVDHSYVESSINKIMFPIDNDEDLYTFKDKIKLDNGFKESLVNLCTGQILTVWV